MAQILVFGDSIAFGFWDREGGWVDRLKKALAKQSIDSGLDNYCPLYNLSIPGDTTEDLLERFYFEFSQRKNDYEKYIIIFAIGINDSHLVGSDKRPKVPIGHFKGNIKQLIKQARQITERIIFIGLTPVDESRTDPLFWIPDRSYTNESINQYNEVIKQVCSQEGAYFIEIYNYFKTDHYIGLLEDGLHPTSEGHKRIFELVEPWKKQF